MGVTCILLVAVFIKKIQFVTLWDITHHLKTTHLFHPQDRDKNELDSTAIVRPQPCHFQKTWDRPRPARQHILSCKMQSITRQSVRLFLLCTWMIHLNMWHTQNETNSEHLITWAVGRVLNTTGTICRDQWEKTITPWAVLIRSSSLKHLSVMNWYSVCL